MKMTTMFMSSAPILSPLQRAGFSTTERSRLCLRQRLLFLPVNSEKIAECRTDGLYHFRVVPSAMLTAEKDAVLPETMVADEKEAVKNVLTLFLRKHELTSADATRTVSISDRFIDHLVSRLHTSDRIRFLIGSKLPILTLEIKDLLGPYLESLIAEHGYNLIDVLENFPDPPPKKKQPNLNMELTSDIRYLIDDIGMNREQIERLICKDPRFYGCGLLGKIKPFVEFLLDLGLSRSHIFSILSKMPYVCYSLSQDIIPTLLYMESLGLDKKQWGDVITKTPRVLSYSCDRVKQVTEFFLASGYSVDDVAVMASLEPRLFGTSVKNLSSKFDFFLRTGYPKSQLVRYPYYFRCSLEQRIKPRFAQIKEKGLKLAVGSFLGENDDEFKRILNIERDVDGLSVNKKPRGDVVNQSSRLLSYSCYRVKQVTEFFMANGFSVDDVAVMASLEPRLFGMSLKSLSSKFDFFLSMGYPKSQLVRYPYYFRYSLERRIKPRFAQIKERGLKLAVGSFIGKNEDEFKRILNIERDIYDLDLRERFFHDLQVWRRG